MTDVVVTVPARLWHAWLAEGDLPGEPWSGLESYFAIPSRPRIEPGERVYVVALGKLRGYAPLVRLDLEDYDLEDFIRGGGLRYYLVRGGGAEAVTLPDPVRGFRGYRYRWWDRSAELPFPDWRTP